jgi:hypothetical protein
VPYPSSARVSKRTTLVKSARVSNHSTSSLDDDDDDEADEKARERSKRRSSDLVRVFPETFVARVEDVDVDDAREDAPMTDAIRLDRVRARRGARDGDGDARGEDDVADAVRRVSTRVVRERSQRVVDGVDDAEDGDVVALDVGNVCRRERARVARERRGRRGSRTRIVRCVHVWRRGCARDTRLGRTRARVSVER